MAGGGGGGESGDFGFQIAPMVDVVFVLLLFFMACAGQNVKEGFFQIGLPSQAPGGADKPIVPIVVDVDQLGNVFVNGDPKSASPKDRDLRQLEEFLKSAMQASPEDPVIIRPSPEARHERVVDVLNACRMARVQKLSFG
jgi:biopolymer transport protein ExbD